MKNWLETRKWRHSMAPTSSTAETLCWAIGMFLIALGIVRNIPALALAGALFWPMTTIFLGPYLLAMDGIKIQVPKWQAVTDKLIAASVPAAAMIAQLTGVVGANVLGGPDISWWTAVAAWAWFIGGTSLTRAIIAQRTYNQMKEALKREG